MRAKLARVLFVPVEGARTVSVAARRIGTAFLWSPDEGAARVLRRDWEDLADVVTAGFSADVTARRGTALQLRPKAANAQVRVAGVDASGAAFETKPCAFYLRRTFTAELVARRFSVARQRPRA